MSVVTNANRLHLICALFMHGEWQTNNARDKILIPNTDCFVAEECSWFEQWLFVIFIFLECWNICLSLQWNWFQFKWNRIQLKRIQKSSHCNRNDCRLQLKVSGNNLHLQSGLSAHTRWVHKLYPTEWLHSTWPMPNFGSDQPKKWAFCQNVTIINAQFEPTLTSHNEPNWTGVQCFQNTSGAYIHNRTFSASQTESNHELICLLVRSFFIIFLLCASYIVSSH